MPGPLIGKWLFIAGVFISCIGGLFYIGVLPGKLGQLPGDINVRRDGFNFSFPIVTCIIISIILTIVLNILARIKR